MNLKPFFQFIGRYPDDIRTTVLTVVYGLAAGLSAVAFLLMTNLVFDHTYLVLRNHSTCEFLAGSFVLIMGSSLLVGLLLTYLSREAAGSGVPQLKAAYWKDLGFVKWRSVWVKFLAGVLSIGGGASLGREGPTVFVAGGCASHLSGFLGVAKQRRRHPAAVGAAAGLAAAFNTPLAAIMFVLEEIIGDMNNRILGSVVLSSVAGAFVVYAVIGKQPAFTLPEVGFPSWWTYLVIPWVAFLSAWVAIVFQRQTLRLRKAVKRVRRLPDWAKPAVGGLATWAIGGAVFAATGRIGVFGLGYHDLSTALADHLDWQVAGLLVVAKLAATILCYGWEGCGGIFAPSLFFGGMCGQCLAGWVGQWIPMTHADRVILSAVGMSACFGALVRAPLTSLLMVFEMTHQFAMVPALMLGVLISQAAARLAGKHNFYDALLIQDGHELIKIKPPRDLQSWQNLPVRVFANMKPVSIRDLSAGVLREVLAAHPYRCFPVEAGGGLKGVLTRDDIESALARRVFPEVKPVGTCFDDETLRNASDKFIQSPTGILVVLGRDNGRMKGLLTLHDLLRAQASVVD